jgi:hypothetical protein
VPRGHGESHVRFTFVLENENNSLQREHSTKVVSPGFARLFPSATQANYDFNLAGWCVGKINRNTIQ